MREIPGKNGGVLVVASPGESLNPSGRPKKLTAWMIQAFTDAGYERVKPSQITAVFEQLLGLTMDELHDTASDPQAPAFIRITCKQLLDKDGGWYAVQAVLDRVHGRPMQKIEIRDEEVGEGDVNWDVVSVDNKRRILELLQQDGAI